ARELSLDEIQKFTTSLEIEAFIHGALCVSYSGQCLFSSLLFDRSGNRGECAGICRLPFTLYEEEKLIETSGKYLLSPKELNTLAHIKELMESNITSFKIEGRMKNPTTIGYITRLYRMLIDQYQQTGEGSISEIQAEELKLLFNRGFTSGYLFHQHGKDIMNPNSPNHIGVEIGQVIEVTKNKIKIKLSKELSQEDGIRFMKEDRGMMINFMYNEKGLLINQGKVGEIIQLDNKMNVKELGPVVKTIDNKLVSTLENYQEKKIEVKIKATITIDQGFCLEISDGTHTVCQTKNIVSVAIKHPTSQDRVKEQLEKLGNTPFKAKDILITMEENIFIPIKEINDLRREVVSEFITIREEMGPIFQEKTIPKVFTPQPQSTKINLNALVRNEEQLQACLENGIDTIYVTNKKLYDQYKNLGNIYLRLERVLSHHPTYHNEKLLVTETGSLIYTTDNEVFTDYYLNVVNSYFVDYLIKNNVKRITLSPELSYQELQNMKNILPDVSLCEMIIYGRLEMMIMKYCPLNMLIHDGNYPCQICNNGKQYYLEDRNHEKYPLVISHGLTHVLNYKNLECSHLVAYQELGIKNYRLEFFDEDYQLAIKVIKKYQKLLIKPS
ncbi:MAG: DUF3656 domain-containing protein, partial [bacterium]|nr:DUF3656 domain-containing protein [bacterium]